MSLNGLEVVEVNEAFLSALKEGGGWFLLKYNTRDEVGLLQRGGGGVGEIQSVVKAYEVESPLYGFIHYRRRNVVLKYVPEGTSRLLLARLAVHFQSITERFSPYDAVFTFAEASELTDSALLATCSLHTAGSLKSVRDSPTRNLDHISEDASESGTIRNQKPEVEEEVAEDFRASKAPSPAFGTGQAPQLRTNGSSRPIPSRERSSSSTNRGLRPRTASDTNKDLPPTPGSTYKSEKPGSIYDLRDYDPRSSIDTRLSTNSARPSTRDLNRAYDYKPKVKLGPRPSMDSHTRPDTANSGDHAFRPVASLPSGVRMPHRKAVPSRPKSHQSQKAFGVSLKIPSQGSAPAPPPVTPVNTTHSFDPKPSGSSNGLQSPMKSPEPKSPRMTPEKRRLMKALQIRQKHMAAQNAAKGPGIEEVTEHQEDSITGTALPYSGTTEGFEPTEETEQTQLEIPGLVKDWTQDPQESPISVPERSDGLSTQASSITDDEVLASHNREGSEVEKTTKAIKSAPGLEDIIREQTQGPVVSREAEFVGNPGQEDAESSAPVISSERQETPKEPIFASKDLSRLSTVNGTTRDHEKTVSVASEGSSEHTLTDKQIVASAEGLSPIQDTPNLNSIEAVINGNPKAEGNSGLIESRAPPAITTPVAGELVAENLEDVATSDHVEAYSNPSSANPSVVALLDELSATTRDGSSLQGEKEAAAAAAAAAEKPSEPALFNMIGSFTGIVSPPETPPTAVTPKESAGVIPSPPDSEISRPRVVLQETNVPQFPITVKNTDASEVVVSTPQPEMLLGSSQATEAARGSISEAKLPAAKVTEVAGPVVQKTPISTVEEISKSNDVPLPQVKPQTVQEMPEAKVVSRPSTPQTSNKPVDASPSTSLSPSSQKARPCTTSKTFIMPKSRSLNLKDKPPMLNLLKNSEHKENPWSVDILKIPDTDEQSLATKSQPEATLKAQPETVSKPQAGEQPEVESELQKAVQPGILSEDEHQHLPEVLSKVAPETLLDSSPEVQTEALPNGPKPESKAEPPQMLPNSQPEAPVEVKPELTPLEMKIQSEIQPIVQPELKPVSSFDIQSGDQLSDEVKSDPKPDSSNLKKAIEDDKQVDRQARRKGVVEPIKRVLTPEQSDEHFLSDDSFMEELKSATLQEAKPISVSRSPIRPVFPMSENDPNAAGSSRASRTVSSPFHQSIEDDRSSLSSRRPAAVSLRSFSGTILPRPDVKTPPGPHSAQPKKFGVSSGISQRIKALENKSSRPTSPVPQAAASPAFLTTRKSSFNSELNGALSKTRSNSAYPSPQTSPETSKSESGNGWGKSRRETVSVTATIVRDAKDTPPAGPGDSLNSPALNLHQSPLVVEHQAMGPPHQQVMGPPQFTPLKPPQPRFSRHSSARSASSSSTEQKPEAAAASRRESSASKRSGMSSRNGSEVDLPRALSDRSQNSNSPLDGISEEKKGSRSSRILKRMSSVTSISRRSIAQAMSPTSRSGSIMEHEEPIAETDSSPSAAIDVGDINVQFPDTLLWKRRHMTIENGDLVMSPSKADNNSRIVTKRYPLADFRPPYIPDQDRQELPNSILLDFNDGSSLQCACEHPTAQAHLLSILSSAHSTHRS